MTAAYRVRPVADRDLDDQADYLATHASLETALRFYDAARATFQELARSPGIGEPWPSRLPRLAGVRVARIQGFEKHLVFYRSADDGIEIIRVLHGARDVERALESGTAE